MVNFKTIKENVNIEIKECSYKLSPSIWETYSSFSNTSGGILYLGIKEHKDKDNEIIGVENPYKLKTDFFNTINNKQKVSLNHLNEDCFHIIKVDNKYVIEIIIKEFNRTLKPIYLNNNLSDTYKRNFDGDYRCNKYEILSMLEDGKAESYDSNLNSKDYTFNNIDINTLSKYRDILNKFNPSNIYKNLGSVTFFVGFNKLIKTGRA